MHRFSLFFLAVMLSGSLARAQSQWMLTTADFRSQAVSVESIDSDGVHAVKASGGQKLDVPFSHFLDISRPLGVNPPTGGFVLFLLGGEELHGEPVALKGNSLAWNNPILGEIDLPMKQIAAIERSAPDARPPQTRQREDVVNLVNGDNLHGIIMDLKDGKVTIQTGGANSSVALATVKEVNFAATAGRVPPVPGFRIRFEDESSIVASSITLHGDKLELSFAKGMKRPVDLSRVSAIEQVNGPVSWLSARQPSESIYTPFFGTDLRFPARMNRNYKGDPIRFGATTYMHGIGVHSYSRLTWPLDGEYRAFRTRYAIDTDEPNTRADVTVRIKLDDKTVYEKEHVRPGALSPVVLEELKGAKKLTLEVDYGANGDTEDRFNWIGPALLKQMPAPEPPPATAPTTAPASSPATAPTTAPSTAPVAH